MEILRKYLFHSPPRQVPLSAIVLLRGGENFDSVKSLFNLIELMKMHYRWGKPLLERYKFLGIVNEEKLKCIDVRNCVAFCEDRHEGKKTDKQAR